VSIREVLLSNVKNHRRLLVFSYVLTLKPIKSLS